MIAIVLTPPPSPRNPKSSTLNLSIPPKPLPFTSAFCCIEATPHTSSPTVQPPNAMPGRGSAGTPSVAELDRELEGYMVPQSGKGGARTAAREEAPSSPVTDDELQESPSRLVRGGGGGK